MLNYLIIIFIVIIDQIAKKLTILYVKPTNTIPIINNIFHLTYVENTGAAFSILSNKINFLITITIIFIIILFVFQNKIPKLRQYLLLNVSISFIIGGAIGNLIDRIRLNYVIDFFDFRLINFAIFNIADCFVVIGTLLLAYLLIFREIEI